MLKSFHEMSKKTKLSKINKVTHPFSLQINLLTFLESLWIFPFFSFLKIPFLVKNIEKKLLF